MEQGKKDKNQDDSLVFGPSNWVDGSALTETKNDRWRNKFQLGISISIFKVLSLR